MNAIAPAGPDAPVLGVTAVWRIAPNAVLILGLASDPPPPRGTVATRNAGNPKSGFQSAVWQPPAPEVGHCHLSALRLHPGDVAAEGETLVLTGQDGAVSLPVRLPMRFDDAASFADALARSAGPHAAAIARFLMRTFSPGARSNPDILAMLAAFLERGGAPDGCVEIVGAIEEHFAILQGWGMAQGAACDAVLVGATVETATVDIARFARPDIQGAATGQLLIVPGSGFDLPALRAIAFLRPEGLLWRPVLAERRVLNSAETVGHVRDIAPALGCDPAARDALRAGLRPRFDGRFTLYDGGHPVRIAIDLAAAAPGAGIYLTGWLYDPAQTVAAVHARGTKGGEVRLDTRWTRVERDDVTGAFRDDASLPPLGFGATRHGFAVHAPFIAEAEDGEVFYLDIAFKDGGCGFVPLTLEPGATGPVRTRLLAGVDLCKPSGMTIVERHLAPFFAAIVERRPACAAVAAWPVPEGLTTAIVIPLDGEGPPKSLLSGLARDPLIPGEAVLFVGQDTQIAAFAASLREQTAFYGIPASMLCIPRAVTPMGALTAVAASTDAARLLLLDPGAIAPIRGWRAALHAALDACGGMSCVSPTIVYEDESIRFAGVEAIVPDDAAPWVRVGRRLAGMPVSLAVGTGPKPSVAGSLACCLMPRAAVSLLGAADSVMTTQAAREADLFMRLARLGAPSVWTPAARIYASDRPMPEQDGNDRRVGRLVDGWCLRARLAAEG